MRGDTQNRMTFLGITGLIGSFREKPGIYPGWHMNKDYWLSVALEAGVEDEKIKFLVDMGYELTK